MMFDYRSLHQNGSWWVGKLDQDGDMIFARGVTEEHAVETLIQGMIDVAIYGKEGPLPAREPPPQLNKG